MTRKKIEIILKVGAAGGSLTLFGSKSANGKWDFFIERNEAAMCDLMDEEDREGFIPISRTPYVHSVEEGLQELSSYPWFMLHPVEVHPEFQEKILVEVKRLGSKSDIERWERRLKWLSGIQLRKKKNSIKNRCGN